MDSHRYTDTSLQYVDDEGAITTDNDEEVRQQGGQVENSSSYNSTNRTSTLPLQRE